MNFDEVYDKYADIVYAFLKQRIQDQYLVEDIVQDTFLSVYNNSHKLRKKESIKSWILTIAHHRMVDRLRKQKSETLSIEDEKIEADHYEDFPSGDILIKEVINKLDGTSRQIIYGLYVLQLRCKDLAQILDIPEGTVKSRAYSARQKIKKWLTREGS